jgi:hypothetical protein
VEVLCCVRVCESVNLKQPSYKASMESPSTGPWQTHMVYGSPNRASGLRSIQTQKLRDAYIPKREVAGDGQSECCYLFSPV